MPEYAKLIIASVSAMVVITLFIMVKSKSFFKAFFISAFSGIGSLFAVNLLSSFTGVTIALNWFSLCVSAFLGVCGSIALVLLNVF